MSDDKPEPVHLVDQLIADIKYSYGDTWLTAAQEEFWRAVIGNFAVTVVVGVLPDDPIAQHAVVRKAQAMGIDIGKEQAPRSSGNVIDMLDHLPRK
jgi:hypothetical protein